MMPNCCGKTENIQGTPQKNICPSNGKEGFLVPYPTVLHHLKQPWDTEFQDQPWYFCDDPACDIAYFGKDNTLIAKSKLRTEIGIKMQGDNGLLCYCYGVTKKDALNPASKNFVVSQTKDKNCACDTKNPSGRCCLKYFPKTKNNNI